MYDAWKVGQMSFCRNVHIYLKYIICIIRYNLHFPSVYLCIFQVCPVNKKFYLLSQVVYLHIYCEKPQCDKACIPDVLWDQVKCITLPEVNLLILLVSSLADFIACYPEVSELIPMHKYLFSFPDSNFYSSQIFYFHKNLSFINLLLCSPLV